MLLGGGLVEVGTDGPCRPEAVLSHHLVHADQDGRLLSRYAGRASAMLDRMPRSELLAAAAGSDAEEATAAAVRHAMDGLLRSYDHRQAVAADSGEELAKLGLACGRDL